MLISASLGLALHSVSAKMVKRPQYVPKLLYPVVLSQIEELDMELTWTTYFVQPWKEGFQTGSKGKCLIYMCLIDIHTFDLIVLQKHACCVCVRCCRTIWLCWSYSRVCMWVKPRCDTPFTTAWKNAGCSSHGIMRSCVWQRHQLLLVLKSQNNIHHKLRLRQNEVNMEPSLMFDVLSEFS